MVLTYYNPNLEIIVSAGASNKGIGACIQHKQTDGTIRPLAFASRSLQPAERNYSQIEKEGLAIIFAVKKFHKYIFGREFTLQTDHKPMLAIFGSKKGIPIYTANRLQRWAIILMSYPFKLQYVNTDSFAYVDDLSRLINPQNFQLDGEFVVASIKLEKQIFQIIDSQLQALPVNFDQLIAAYSADTIMNRVIDCISNDWHDYSSSSEPQLKQFFNRRTSLSISKGVILLVGISTPSGPIFCSDGLRFCSKLTW